MPNSRMRVDQSCYCSIRSRLKQSNQCSCIFILLSEQNWQLIKRRNIAKSMIERWKIVDICNYNFVNSRGSKNGMYFSSRLILRKIMALFRNSYRRLSDENSTKCARIVLGGGYCVSLSLSLSLSLFPSRSSFSDSVLSYYSSWKLQPWNE